jgi:Secretion system C-terminal sorting domain
MKSNKYIPILFLFLCQSYSSFSQWNYLGLSHAGLSTNLTIYNDTLYASTHDGIYKKHVLSMDTNWVSCGMQGNHVVQTLVRDYQNFICVVEIGATKTTQIYKSSNGGISFSLMNTDTSNWNSYQFLNVIAHPEGNYDTLYFLNHQLKTYDGGITWDTIANYNNVNRFIKVDPLNHNQLIIGGELMILRAFLQTSPDNGTNWLMPNMMGYFNGDNSVHDLVMDSNNTWTAVGEGVICRTIDGGSNWTQLLNVWSWIQEWALYIFDIEVSPVDNNKIYATGTIHSGGSRVPLLYSQNNGATWDTLSTASLVSPQFINCLAVKNTLSGDKVFIGGTGVYVYQNNFSTAINELNKITAISVFPNPFSSSTTLQLSQVLNSGTLTIYNLYGQPVQRIDNLNGKTIMFNRTNMAPGLYFVQVSQDNKIIASDKILIKD